MLSQGVIRKMTNHRMIPHVFGTLYTPHLPPKTMMEFMGIVKYEIVNRYVNFSRAERVGQFVSATGAFLATRCSRRKRSHATLGGGAPSWPGKAFEALLERARNAASRKLNRGFLRYVLSLADNSRRR